MEEVVKVIILPSWYPTDEMQLNGIFFKEQAVALKKLGVDVAVIYPEVRQISTITFRGIAKNHMQIEVTEEEGIKTYRTKGWNLYPKLYKLQIKSWISQTLKMVDLYIKENGIPDIIHAHSAIWGGYAAMLVSRKYNVPYIVTEHSSAFALNQILDWQIPYINEVFENAEEIISVSSGFSKILEVYSKGRRFKVLPNPVDTQFFDLPSSFDERISKPFTFISVGFLNENKCYDMVIEAFNLGFNGQKDIQLLIGGEGAEKEKLQQLISKYKLEKQVKLIGLLNREEVLNNFQKSNVLVCSSNFETFGVALIEALATGIPVISTRCGGPEDIINKDVGLLVDVSDVAAYSEAMVKVFKNYANFQSENIRNYVIDNYSNASIIRKQVDIYKDLIKLHKGIRKV